MSQPWASPYLNMGMNLVNTRTFEPYIQEESPGFLESLWNMITGAASYGAGSYLGGPSGFAKWFS